MTLRIKPEHDALVIVDLQPTFFPVDPVLPGSGELPVPHADRLVAPINGLADRFKLVAATQDAHPADHLSFASQFSDKRPFDELTLEDVEGYAAGGGPGGIDLARLRTYIRRVGSQTLWPDHGRAGTPGGGLHPELNDRAVDLVVTKGEDRYFDSYSAFFDNGHFAKTRLDDALRVRGITRVFVAGLALDFCVRYTALDARKLGYEVVVLEDCCAAIDRPPGFAAGAWRQMLGAGVIRAASADITSAVE